VILRTTGRFLLPLFLLYSLYLLLGGHHNPGGGFAGGLTAAAGFALYALAFDVDGSRRLLRFEPRSFVAIGLLVAAGSGLPALPGGGAFLGGRWGRIVVPGFGALELGTPLLFDAGVYLVVVGMALWIVLALLEE
jgi:multicomponent Na+:H+ antiporter subunit B